MALLTNKRAHFDYDILEKFEAGIVLHGFEVKSLKQKHGSLQGAYVTFDENHAYLVKMFIPPYQVNNTPDSYDPERRRTLLIKKSELAKLLAQKKSQGVTTIPISVYIKNNLLKVELGIARGKKKHDKRESIKKRDSERDLGRKLKG